MLAREQLPFATGKVRFSDRDGTIWDSEEPRILVRVKAEPDSESFLAVVDTAAPWCILRPGSDPNLRRNLEPLNLQVILSTRLGRFRGDLYRGELTIFADDGEPLTVDATIFLSPDWQGPNFIGYSGLLQRIRFAVDPAKNLFYFGPL